jgi:threonine synthase
MVHGSTDFAPEFMALKFVSTRSDESRLNFLRAVLDGIAPDGGLFMPERIPALDEMWRGFSEFPSMAAAVLNAWIDPGDRSIDVSRVVKTALDFPVPLVRVSGGPWHDVTVVELFHGPTLSFKDFGARCMAGFMAGALAAGEEKTILVATSGDTGSAVADGFSGFDSIHVVLLYPRGQVSPTQERQLVVRREGVTTFAVDGTFDDCQRMVKEVFAREDADQRFTSANSINVGRLLPQMTYYFWAANHLADRRFRCCVPSGNLGNLTAGVLAHLSGIRPARFLAAHNANRFFPDFLTSGEESYPQSVRTLSNAMDVGVPSNFERLRHVMSREAMQELIWGTTVSDDETLQTMRDVYDATGYVADPHTAVGFEAVRRYRCETGDEGPIAIMSTAHPAKFPEAVRAALGFEPEIPERLAAYWRRDTRASVIGPDTDELLSSLRDAGIC